MTQTILASLARIADFATQPFEVRAVPHADWCTGDYVVARVGGLSSELFQIEDCVGDLIPVQPGTLVIGALGERAATLEGVGTWRVFKDGKLHAMTRAGLFGVFTSLSRFVPEPICLDYLGHTVRGDKPVRMADFALPASGNEYAITTILLVGSSMSAGKTLAGKLVCKLLSAEGLHVIGTKLTGAGRYRDILSFRRAGAIETYDFVDVGLPSTVVPEDEYRAAIRPLLQHIGGRRADFVVAEAGASPLEPYNAEAAIDELAGHIGCTILCASDPYAVVGVIDAFGIEPDIVTGPASNTSAAVDLVDKLTGIRAISTVDPEAESAFRKQLFLKLGLPMGKAAKVSA